MWLATSHSASTVGLFLQVFRTIRFTIRNAFRVRTEQARHHNSPLHFLHAQVTHNRS